MTLLVGQGIADRMKANQDRPVQDSVFITNSDGTKVEKCLGFKGLYIATNAGGNWESAGPLPVAG